MPTNTSGGTTTSFMNTPQAKDDNYTGVYEDNVYIFDVMANDLGGNAKILWSIDDTNLDGTTGTTGSGNGTYDLLSQDTASSVPEYSDLGAKISIYAGKIRYDASVFNYLAAGQSVTDKFTYAIRLSNGTLSWATVTITVVGSNDGPTISAANLTGAVTEDAADPTLSSTGTITFDDADLTNTHTTTVTAASANAYGGVLTATITDTATGAGDGTVTWNYTVPNSATQGLGQGDTATETFTIRITDNSGGYVERTVTITITGTGDAPVITAGNDTGSVSEDGLLQATGNLDSTDLDIGDTPTWSAGTATYGTASIDPVTGEWTYVLNNGHSAVQGLGEGDPLTDSFVVTVTDEDGLIDTVTVTITITGDGDAPIITAGNDAGAVSEDGVLQATGNLDSTDLDIGDAPTWSAGAATYGTASIDPVTGEWTYVLNNDHPAVQELGEGDPLSDSFVVTVTDEDGLTDTVTVNITITGDGDAPVITAGNDTGAVSEDGTLQATGNLDSTDVDVGDTPVWSAGAATYGIASINPATGAWTYVLNNGHPSVQGLGEGDLLSDIFLVTVTDEDGLTDTVTVTLTITGDGDAPVITAGNDTGAVSEDGILQATGNLDSTDLDLNDVPIWSISTGANYGTASIDPATGEWTYNLNNSHAAVQGLGEGDQLTDTFVVLVTDEGGLTATRSVTITITGDGDAPVITAGNDTGDVGEDGDAFPLQVTGNLDSTDLDVGDTPSWSAGAATYGTASIDPATGEWTYVLDNGLAAVQGLGEGDILSDSFLVTVTDEDGLTDTVTVNITITGDGDAPVITAGNDTGAAAEDGALQATGDLGSTDLDIGDDHSWSVTTSAGYGTASVNPATGVWTYDLNNGNSAVQGLGEGDQLSDSFVVTVTDEDGLTDTRTVTITITGAGDAPVITAGNDTGSVSEDDVLQATGNLDSTDLDVGDTPTWSAGVASYGTASIDPATGEWTYVLDNGLAAVQGLGEGDILSDSFLVTVTDEDGLTDTVTVNITITGNGDAPVIAAGNDTGAAAEDGALQATGDFGSTDVDVDDDHVWSVSTGAAYGTASIDPATGVWTFDLNNGHAAVQGLGEGDLLLDTFVVTVTDEDGLTDTRTVTITITGDGDAPVITAGNDTGNVSEDGTLHATGNLDSTDLDIGDIPTWSAGTATYGTASIDPVTGEWTYVLNNDHPAVQGLGEGDPLSDSFVVTVTDEDGLTDTVTVSITITGDGDAPVITTGNDVGAVSEDGNLQATGNLDANDLDIGDTPTWSAGAANYGSALIDPATGEWTYVLDNGLAAVQGLGEGDILSDSFVVTVTDEDGLTDTVTVNITITGDGDAPVITAGNDTGDVGEDGDAFPLQATGNLDATDLDAGDTHSWAVSSAAAYGTASIDPATGAWTYDLNNGHADVQGLADGETLNDSFIVTVTDEDGLTDTRTVSITITGSNDAPVLTGDLAAPIDEGGSYQLTLSDLNFTDPDDSASEVTFTASGLSNGTLYVNGIAGNSFTGAQLAAGLVTFVHNGSETVTAGFNVLVEDGNEDGSAPVAQPFTFTVSPVNDAPVNAVPGAQAVNEDQTLVFSTANGNAISIADVDAGSNAVQVSLSVASGALTLGSLAGVTVTGGANGSSTITIQGTLAAINAALQGLAYQGNLNFNGGDSLSIVTSDLGNSGSGGALIDSDSVAISVNAVNDAPVNVMPAGYTSPEDQQLILSGLSVSDVDAGAGNVTVTLHVNSGAILMGSSFTVVSSGSGTDTVTITGTVAAVNAFLSNPGVQPTFSPAGNANGPVMLTMTTTDNGNSGSGGAQTDIDIRTINVTPVNDSPYVADEIEQQSFNEDTFVSFQVPAGTFIDPDGDALTYSATLWGGAALPSWLSFDAATQTFSGTPPQDYFDDLLVTVSASDGQYQSDETFYISILAVNDAPVNTLPAAFSVVNNATVKLGGLSVADVDSGAGAITVTLSVASGTLTASNATGVTVGGSGTGTITLTGQLFWINQYLGSAITQPTFTPVAGSTGPVTLTMTTNDNGHYGSGGALTDTDLSTITVTAANAAPTDLVFALALSTGSLTGNGINSGVPLGSFSAVDPDSASWTFAISPIASQPFPALAINPTTGALSTNGSVGPGNYQFTIAVTDAQGQVYSENFTLSVGTNQTDGSLAFTVTSGTDISFGLNGSDTITGGNGDDALVGGQAADTITGGGGADQMIGGQQADTFVYNAVSDSTATARDIILDFESSGNVDQINLSAIDANLNAAGNQVFAFVAAQNAGVVNNSITWFQDIANNRTMVQVDNNGDGIADMVIQLNGIHSLNMGDFIP